MRIAIVGYGRMGHAVEEVARRRGHRIVARLGRGDDLASGTLAGADVAVEFTRPEAAVDNLRRIADTGTDAVVGTTGWYDRLDEARGLVERAGVGLVHAPNFSLGVHVLFRLTRELGRLIDLIDDYDVHVQEAHHRHKVDHPSGTARRLAEILLETVRRKERWAEGAADGATDPATLQVTSLRAGEIPGTHVVGVEGPDDRIELRHEARSRSGFARGAVTAAEWIRGRVGVYSLDDVVADLLENRGDGT